MIAPLIHCSITGRFLLLIQTELDFIRILTLQVTVRTVNLTRYVRYRLFDALV